LTFVAEWRACPVPARTRAVFPGRAGEGAVA
jgi:hypothetical protein